MFAHREWLFGHDVEYHGMDAIYCLERMKYYCQRQMGASAGRLATNVNRLHEIVH
jgi:hypothetical protein